MITPNDLASAMARNLGTIQEYTKGLTHADSLLQPPVQGNCMNWVLGHIAGTRDLILRQLGAEPILTEAESKRYGYGSEPVCADGEDILKLDRLLALLAEAQERIATVLERATPEMMSKEVESFLGKTTLGKLLFFLFYHETYHLGQLELLRELARSSR